MPDTYEFKEPLKEPENDIARAQVLNTQSHILPFHYSIMSFTTKDITPEQVATRYNDLKSFNESELERLSTRSEDIDTEQAKIGRESIRCFLKRLEEANHVLSNPIKKAIYDKNPSAAGLTDELRVNDFGAFHSISYLSALIRPLALAASIVGITALGGYGAYYTNKLDPMDGYSLKSSDPFKWLDGVVAKYRESGVQEKDRFEAARKLTKIQLAKLPADKLHAQIIETQKFIKSKYNPLTLEIHSALKREFSFMNKVILQAAKDIKAEREALANATATAK